jgi:hypothetical protein
VSGHELTATTVSYLFASTWAPPAESGWSLPVPGGKVDGPDTAANLLNLAVWSLREQGLVDVEQIRPVEAGRVTVMGGKSFVRVTALDPVTPLPGLEGALLDAIRERPGTGDALGKFLSRDDPNGLRGCVLALNLSSASPWATVAGYCRKEALDAGLIAIEGRLSKKPVIADRAALDELRSRDSEIAAARAAYREREADLDVAVITDCLHAVHWAHQTPND